MDDLALPRGENQGVRVKIGLKAIVDYVTIPVFCYSLQTRLEAPAVGCDVARETAVLKNYWRIKQD
jgi:hypothetical protein